MALLIVLWASALLAILIGGYALLSRSEAMQSRYQFELTQARYAAEAGIERAVYGLSLAQPATRWIPDGRDYHFRFGTAKVVVAATDEAGKVDLNAADETVLAALFRQVGAGRQRAESLAAAVADWRDRDSNVRVNGAEAPEYRAAGRAYGPRNDRFASIEELQQVLGMDASLYQAVAPYVTLWSGRNRPSPRFAPATVLATLPGVSERQARDFVRQRRAMTPGQNTAAPTLPGQNGALLIGAGHGQVQSIRAEAALPDGTRAQVEAVVRLGRSLMGRPYTVLRWIDGNGPADASTPSPPRVSPAARAP